MDKARQTQNAPSLRGGPLGCTDCPPGRPLPTKIHLSTTARQIMIRGSSGARFMESQLRGGFRGKRIRLMHQAYRIVNSSRPSCPLRFSYCISSGYTGPTLLDQTSLLVIVVILDFEVATQSTPCSFLCEKFCSG
jgi:hypothetical protein